MYVGNSDKQILIGRSEFMTLFCIYVTCSVLKPRICFNSYMQAFYNKAIYKYDAGVNQNNYDLIVTWEKNKIFIKFDLI